MKLSHKTILSSVIGNALENYDYVLYANFAVIISKLFFPSNDPYTSLLATFGVFAVGFFMRPIGAMIFGHIGDKHSRKIAFSISILLMSFSTSLIGILPSYEKAGIVAPLALIAIRLLQGLSIGGETSSFMVYLMESNSNTKRPALLGSVALSSTAFGLFLGFVASFICNFYFQENEFAWRVPFLISLPIGLIGFYIRTKLGEGAEFQTLKKKKRLSKSPLKELLKNHKKEFLTICGLFVSISVPFYIFFAFLSTFLVKILGHGQLQVSVIYLICSFAFIVFPFLSGWLSDRFGIYKILLTAVTLFAIVIFPIFGLILSKDFVLTLIGCFSFIFFITLYQGSIPSMVTKIFPTKIRATGTALSFNIVSAIFGGLSPLVLTYLIKVSEDYRAIPLYLVGSSMLTIIALTAGRRKGVV